MSDAFDVPTEIADVTIVGPLPVPVTGTFTPSGTQDVNIVSSVTLAVTIPTPVPVTDNGGSLTVDGSVAITNFPATQPISGIVTSNQGTPASTANRWPVQITDGTDLALVTAAGAVVVDGSGVTQPISAVSLPLPTGAATSALQTQPGVDIGDVTVNNAAGASAVNIQDGGNSITVDGTVAVSNFPAIQPISGTVTANQGTSPWVISGSVTANAGTNLNTSALATETTLVTLLTGKAASSSNSNVSASASNVTLLSSNSSRKMATFYNDSAFRLFLKFGATATSSSFTVRIDSQGYYELPVPVYTGQIDGIWTGATGAVRISELS